MLKIIRSILQKFIDDTKAKGAEIIFATPTANGTKNKDTGIYDEDYKFFIRKGKGTSFIKQRGA